MMDGFAGMQVDDPSPSPAPAPTPDINLSSASIAATESYLPHEVAEAVEVVQYESTETSESYLPGEVAEDVEFAQYEDCESIALMDANEEISSPRMNNPFEFPLPSPPTDLIVSDTTGHAKRIHNRISKSYREANAIMNSDSFGSGRSGSSHSRSRRVKKKTEHVLLLE
jgi:hypothetical protein